MSPQEKLFKKSYAKILLDIADGDLQSAQVLRKASRGRRENICFLAQQAIEKALKAVLIWHQVAFPLVHDAGILVAKMPSGILPPEGYDLSLLTQYATVRRYEEGAIEITEADLDAILKVAESVFTWARQIVGGD